MLKKKEELSCMSVHLTGKAENEWERNLSCINESVSSLLVHRQKFRLFSFLRLLLKCLPYSSLWKRHVW